MYVKVPRVATGNVKKFSSPYHGPYVIVSLNGLNADVRALGMSGLPIVIVVMFIKYFVSFEYFMQFSLLNLASLCLALNEGRLVTGIPTCIMKIGLPLTFSSRVRFG